MKNKILAVYFLFVILAGCASVPKLPADTKFALADFKVDLVQKLQIEGYPVQPEFSQIVKDKFTSSLKAKGLAGESGVNNAVSVSVDIKYKRQFSGEDTPFPSKSVMSPVFGYTLVVSENGVEKNRIVKSGLELKSGLLGSLKILGLLRDAKDELSDIQKVTDLIAAEFVAIKK